MHQRLSLASLCRLLSIWSSGTGGTSSSLPVIITVFFNKVKIVNINIIVSCHGSLGALLGVISSALNKIHHNHHYYHWHHFVSGTACRSRPLLCCYSWQHHLISSSPFRHGTPNHWHIFDNHHYLHFSGDCVSTYLAFNAHLLFHILKHSFIQNNLWATILIIGDLSLEKSFAQLQLEGKRLLGKKEVIWNNAC